MQITVDAYSGTETKHHSLFPTPWLELLTEKKNQNV
jgi:hypothetical protein